MPKLLLMECVSELLSFMLWLVLLSEAKRANVVQKGSREQLLLCGNTSLGWCYGVATNKQTKGFTILDKTETLTEFETM